MAIMASAKGSGNFTPHPEGQYTAVCVDVHDVGKVQTVYNGQQRMTHKVDLYFFCDEYKELEGGDQMPLFVRERFTVSLADSSRLLPFVEKWRGKLTKEEKEAFDLETLIGCGALIQVSHNDYEDKTFANIDSIMKLPKGSNAPPIPADYVRLQDRPPRDGEKRDDKIGQLMHSQRKDQRQMAAAAGGRDLRGEPDPVRPFDDGEDDLPFD